MQIGVVGLGRMGGNIVRRLMRAGHSMVVFDARPDAVAALGREGATEAASLGDLVARLTNRPRVAWAMLPHGEATENAVVELARAMAPGDIVIDGGNTHYKDDIRRAKALAARGIRYLDVGTSGGVRGLERGYCLMIGGDGAAVEHLDPIFAALAPGLGGIARTPGRADRDPRAERGYLHVGPSGAGHFVKMIHNGIEYGMMQAIAEGFDILRGRDAEHLPAEERFDLDLGDIAELWRRGSVITSWLLDLAAAALAADPRLDGFAGRVADFGEGRWAAQAAIESGVPAEALAAALFARFRSRRDHAFAGKLLSAMRLGFGGHGESPRRADD